MQKIIFLALALALSLLPVQPLLADTISFTIQEDFVQAPGALDPWGIGSGSGTASFNFTLSPSPNRQKSTLSGVSAFYLPGSPTLTLAGTNVNGVYGNPSFEQIVLVNSFNGADEYSALFFFPLGGKTYTFAFCMALPASFWGTSQDPPLPELLSQSDVICPLYGEIRDSGNYLVDIYRFTNVTVSSQVVPGPPTVWLLASGLAGLTALRRRFRS
jgi:hypothetical protein